MIINNTTEERVQKKEKQNMTQELKKRELLLFCWLKGPLPSPAEAGNSKIK